MLDWLRVASLLLRRGRIGIDVLWQTLIDDSDRDISAAPAQYGKHFAHYHLHIEE